MAERDKLLADLENVRRVSEAESRSLSDEIHYLKQRLAKVEEEKTTCENLLQICGERTQVLEKNLTQLKDERQVERARVQSTEVEKSNLLSRC